MSENTIKKYKLKDMNNTDVAVGIDSSQLSSNILKLSSDYGQLGSKITWDGDTTGLEYVTIEDLEMNYYKVSSSSLSSTELVGKNCTLYEGSESMTTTLTEDMIVAGTPTSGTGYAVYVGSDIPYFFSVSAADTYTWGELSVTFTNPGLYFIQLTYSGISVYVSNLEISATTKINSDLIYPTTGATGISFYNGSEWVSSVGYGIIGKTLKIDLTGTSITVTGTAGSSTTSIDAYMEFDDSGDSNFFTEAELQKPFLSYGNKVEMSDGTKKGIYCTGSSSDNTATVAYCGTGYIFSFKTTGAKTINMTYEETEVTFTVTVSSTGTYFSNVDGVYIKSYYLGAYIDNDLIDSNVILPTSASDGTGIVYYNNTWNKQTNYAYINNQTITYDGSTTGTYVDMSVPISGTSTSLRYYWLKYCKPYVYGFLNKYINISTNGTESNQQLNFETQSSNWSVIKSSVVSDGVTAFMILKNDVPYIVVSPFQAQHNFVIGSTNVYFYGSNKAIGIYVLNSTIGSDAIYVSKLTNINIGQKFSSDLVDTVSVSSTGTATDTVSYITINGTEKKLAGGSGGTSDFDQLTNRPKYNGTTMSSSTSIPEVKTSTWDAKSTVSGVNDGTNWTSITIDGTTKTIPSGGGGGSLPSASTDGTAAIYYNNGWHAQTGYGYSNNAIPTGGWDGDTTGKTGFTLLDQYDMYYCVDSSTPLASAIYNNSIVKIYDVMETTTQTITLTSANTVIYYSNDTDKTAYIVEYTTYMAYPIIVSTSSGSKSFTIDGNTYTINFPSSGLFFLNIYQEEEGEVIQNRHVQLLTVSQKINSELIPVSGSNDGTNWTSLTIGDTTKAIGSSTPTNMVTTDTSQSISGVKTFNSGKLKTTNIVNSSGNTLSLPTNAGTLAIGSYQTTMPTSAINDGGIHIVVVNDTYEEDTKYNGYIYFFKATE